MSAGICRILLFDIEIPLECSVLATRQANISSGDSGIFIVVNTARPGVRASLPSDSSQYSGYFICRRRLQLRIREMFGWVSAEPHCLHLKAENPNIYNYCNLYARLTADWVRPSRCCLALAKLQAIIGLLWYLLRKIQLTFNPAHNGGDIYSQQWRHGDTATQACTRPHWIELGNKEPFQLDELVLVSKLWESFGD